jgi:hypothetical protein
MNYPTLISVAVAAYLFGSIPFGYLLVRVFQGIDVRSIGSGNIGATNVARTGGKGLAIATLALDTLKGWLPVFLVLTLRGADRITVVHRNRGSHPLRLARFNPRRCCFSCSAVVSGAKSVPRSCAGLVRSRRIAGYFPSSPEHRTPAGWH